MCVAMSRLKRSNSQDLDDKMDEFKRNGLRSTTGGRLGWSKEVKCAFFSFEFRAIIFTSCNIQTFCDISWKIVFAHFMIIIIIIIIIITKVLIWVTHCKNMLLGHFTKLQKYNVPNNNVQLAKWQTKRVSFGHSSERQQGVRISYLRWQILPGACMVS